MTSVTVAGGSFEVPKEARRKIGKPSLSPRSEKWLRYGVGVSIAGLLAANGLTLASMLGDVARELTGDDRRHAAPAAAQPADEAPGTATAAATTGSGFAAIDLPADLEAHFRSATAASAGGALAAGAPATLETTDPGAFIPVAGPAPATAPTGGQGPATTPPPSGTTTPPATDPSVVDQLVVQIAQVPEVGDEVAPVVAEVADTTEAVVEDEVVAPVADELPAPVGSAVESTVDGLL